jgi:hypothetical protein
VHFLQNVAAADQVSVDVQLGVCGPLAVHFDLFPDDSIVKHVDALELGETYISIVLTILFEQLDHKIGVAASGLVRSPLHKEDDLVVLDPLVDDQLGVLLGDLVVLALAVVVVLLVVAEPEHQPSR